MRTLLNIAILAGLGALSVGAVSDAMTDAASDALAQEQTPPPPPPPAQCQSEKFHQFDFWVGTWDVFGTADGQLKGVNRIEKVEKGCLIKENWTSSQGGTGFSINYYDAVTDQWRQVWVAGGYSIDYVGGLNAAGQMVLEGEIHYYQRGARVPFKGTWTPNADGSVRQFFEQYDAEKEAWTTWFDGTYVRQKD